MPRNLFRVLEAALEIGEVSDGALDIGVGDLVKAWVLGAGSRSSNLGAIAEPTGRASFHPPLNLQPDCCIAQSPTARTAAPLILCVIAKGFGVDNERAVHGRSSACLPGSVLYPRRAARGRVEGRRSARGGWPRTSKPRRAHSWV